MNESTQDLELVQDVFGEMSRDMGRMLEHPLAFRGVCYQRKQQRAVGEHEVHVSFKFSLETPSERKLGCFLVPLKHATLMASYLLALGENLTDELCEVEQPEQTMKESMLLLGQILSSSVGRALKRKRPGAMRVRSEGCQAVRADVRPAFAYLDGEPLLVGRAAARVGSFEAFSPILMLPILA